MKTPLPEQLAVVTIDGLLTKTNFHFRVVDTWSLGTGAYVFFDAIMSPAVEELLNRLSMWGGHSKIHPDIEGAMGWEFDRETLPVLQKIIDRTRFNRPEDVCR